MIDDEKLIRRLYLLGVTGPTPFVASSMQALTPLLQDMREHVQFHAHYMEDGTISVKEAAIQHKELFALDRDKIWNRLKFSSRHGKGYFDPSRRP